MVFLLNLYTIFSIITKNASLKTLLEKRILSLKEETGLSDGKSFDPMPDFSSLFGMATQMASSQGINVGNGAMNMDVVKGLLGKMMGGGGSELFDSVSKTIGKYTSGGGGIGDLVKNIGPMIKDLVPTVSKHFPDMENSLSSVSDMVNEAQTAGPADPAGPSPSPNGLNSPAVTD